MILFNTMVRDIASKTIKEDVLLRDGFSNTKSFTDKKGLKNVLQRNFREMGNQHIWGDVSFEEIVEEITDMDIDKLLASTKVKEDDVDADIYLESISDSTFQKWAEEMCIGIKSHRSEFKSKVHFNNNYGTVKLFKDDEDGTTIRETDLITDSDARNAIKVDKTYEYKSRISSLMVQLFEYSKRDNICILGLILLKVYVILNMGTSNGFSFSGKLAQHPQYFGVYNVEGDVIRVSNVNTLNADKKWRRYLATIFNPGSMSRDIEESEIEFFLKVKYCAEELQRLLVKSKLIDKFSRLRLEDLTQDNIYKMGIMSVGDNDIYLLNKNVNIDVIKCLNRSLSTSNKQEVTSSDSILSLIELTKDKYRELIRRPEISAKLKSHRKYKTLDHLIPYYTSNKYVSQYEFDGCSFIGGIYCDSNQVPYIFDGSVFDTMLPLTSGLRKSGVILTDTSLLLYLEEDKEVIRFKFAEDKTNDNKFNEIKLV